MPVYRKMFNSLQFRKIKFLKFSKWINYFYLNTLSTIFFSFFPSTIKYHYLKHIPYKMTASLSDIPHIITAFSGTTSVHSLRRLTCESIKDGCSSLINKFINGTFHRFIKSSKFQKSYFMKYINCSYFFFSGKEGTLLICHESLWIFLLQLQKKVELIEYKNFLRYTPFSSIFLS